MAPRCHLPLPSSLKVGVVHRAAKHDSAKRILMLLTEAFLAHSLYRLNCLNYDAVSPCLYGRTVGYMRR